MTSSKILMIVIDVIAVGIFIYQLITKNIYIPSYMMLLACNILVFFSKKEDEDKK